MAIDWDSKDTFAKAVRNLKPNTEYRFEGDDVTTEDAYNKVQWVTGKDSNDMAILSNTCPHSELTWAKVSAEINRINTQYTNDKYRRDRKVKYPDIGDQLDNLYKDILAGKVDSTGEFAKAIKSVKDSVPKP